MDRQHITWVFTLCRRQNLFSSQQDRNRRDLRYHMGAVGLSPGIAISEAANVAVTNNISGNNPGNTAQQYGVALFYQHTKPMHLTMSNYTLSRNAVASVAPPKRR